MNKSKLVFRKTKKPITEVETIEQSVKDFNSCLDSLNTELVGRSEHITALKLCIISRQNMMLVGTRGNAKTMFVESAFEKIKGAKYWGRQFMKGTLVDEVFGPMRAKLYREEEKFAYQTEGMLPEAHFALCDEVYRASDSLLDATLRILNEKKFFNGTKDTHCPLISAVGTTNFITDSPELEAFHDRWLVRMNVLYLTKSVDVCTMIDRFINEGANNKLTISLESVQAIRKAIKRVRISKEVIELYQELVDKYVKKLGGERKTSDRRICQSLLLGVSSYVLAGENKPDTFTPDFLAATKYGLCTSGNDTISRLEESAFTDQFTAVIGDYEKESRAIKTFDKVERKVRQMESMYDDKMGKTKVAEMFVDTSKLKKALEEMTDEEKPKSIKQRNRREELLKKLSVLRDSLDEQNDQKVLKQYIAELKAKQEAAASFVPDSVAGK